MYFLFQNTKNKSKISKKLVSRPKISKIEKNEIQITLFINLFNCENPRSLETQAKRNDEVNLRSRSLSITISL